jgi:hypothetical protein
MSSDNEETEESYSFDEPTPADDVYVKNGTQYIRRMGYPPIEVGGGATAEDFE